VLARDSLAVTRGKLLNCAGLPQIARSAGRQRSRIDVHSEQVVSDDERRSPQAKSRREVRD
jgi:hypothetical protein